MIRNKCHNQYFYISETCKRYLFMCYFKAFWFHLSQIYIPITLGTGFTRTGNIPYTYAVHLLFPALKTPRLTEKLGKQWDPAKHQ